MHSTIFDGNAAEPPHPRLGSGPKRQKAHAFLHLADAISAGRKSRQAEQAVCFEVDDVDETGPLLGQSRYSAECDGYAQPQEQEEHQTPDQLAFTTMSHEFLNELPKFVADPQ
jgi:hypothetical protein